MVMVLRNLGKILAVQDEDLWSANAKMKYEDISFFWRDKKTKVNEAILMSLKPNNDARKSHRIKMILSKNPGVYKELMQLVKTPKIESFLEDDIAIIFDAYIEEAKHIHIALQLEAYRDLNNITAQDIANLLSVNKNNVLAWISHKKNMPIQAYNEAKSKFLNFR